MHARFLFEPQAYPDSTFVSVFDKYFGAADQRGKTTCAIEFEPNPMHAARHEKLSAAYAKVGWRVVFAPYAVSDAAGQLTFFDNDGGDNEDWCDHAAAPPSNPAVRVSPLLPPPYYCHALLRGVMSAPSVAVSASAGALERPTSTTRTPPST